MDLGLGAPVPQEPEPEGRTELRVVSGPGAGTVFRLVPGDYDIGSDATCRIRLAPGRRRSPPGSGCASTARRNCSSPTRPAGRQACREHRRLARGQPTRRRRHPAGADLADAARAPLTPAADGLGLEFNRPPGSCPHRGKGEFRLPTPPVKPDKRPIPLLPILLLPAGGAVVAILVTHRWAFIFIALLSPIAALVTQFGSRKQAMVKYLEQKEEYERRSARVRADIDAAVV